MFALLSTALLGSTLLGPLLDPLPDPILLVSPIPQASPADGGGRVAAATELPPPRLAGLDEEWREVPAAAEDPAGDQGGGVIDLRSLQVRETPEDLWLRVAIGERPVNVQSLGESLELLVDIDGDAATGERRGSLDGVDLAVRFSPRGRGISREGRGSTIEIVEPKLVAGEDRARLAPPFPTGIGAAPTTASTWLEFRLPRAAGTDAASGLRFGDTTRLAVRTVAADGTSLDEIAPATWRFDTAASRVARVARALPRAGRGALRVMSWNVERGGLFNDPTPFERVLKGVRPDAILFQELDARATPQALATWLDERVPVRGGWKVAVIDGDLRVAVASPDLRPAPALARVERPLPDGVRTVRAVGAIRRFEGRRVLLVSVHLKCCGSIGSREDRIREAEILAIREAVRETVAEAARTEEPIDGIVIGGDFNLVGGPQVLAEAVRGLDLDGGPLAVAPLYASDGLANLTWRDARSEFMPGRLDFILFGDAPMEMADGMVVDPAAFLPRGAAPDGPSDHLPLVVDLRWKAVADARRR